MRRYSEQKLRNAAHGLSTTHYVETDEAELEYNVTARVTAYHPAKLYGPPEDCYPEEGGEVEDIEITLDGQPVSDEAFIARHGQDEMDRLVDSLTETAGNWEPDYPDSDDCRDDF